MVKELGLEESKQVRLFRGRGCDACYDSGFKSRIGIHELIAMDEKLQGMILESSDGDALKSHLRQSGHRTMRLDGYQKVIEGVTTIEEVRRTLSL